MEREKKKRERSERRAAIAERGERDGEVAVVSVHEGGQRARTKDEHERGRAQRREREETVERPWRMHSGARLAG